MSFQDLTDEETAAALAGLRMLQSALERGDLKDFAPVSDIYTDGGRFEGLPANQIDDLCDKINLTTG